jgi:prepilin-type N-terminal cleavage/methylation domain-containing protein
VNTKLTNRKTRHGRQATAAFTLIELLVVISIIGLLAALSMPVINNFKPNYAASATRQLLDDLARARQLAVSQRTTVFMVFVPTNFWAQPACGKNWTAEDWLQASNLLDKQFIGYNFVSLHSVGDQPGSNTPRYLGEWRTLPEGSIIDPAKFGDFGPAPVLQVYTNNGGPPMLAYNIYGLHKTDRFFKNPLPFPDENIRQYSPAYPYISVPYIAFDYSGRLVTFENGQPVYGRDEIIPLGKGNVSYSRDPVTKVAIMALPTVTESPPGNTTNAFNLVHIDWLTGRARVERQEVR